MTRLPGPPDEGCDALVHGSLLSPVIRRDVADLNREFLELGLACELAGDPRFAWSDAVRQSLVETDEATRARMAASPFTFFELRLPPAGPCGVAVPGGIADSARALVASDIAGRCASFVHLALFLAWRLADAAPLATCIALGLPPAAESRLHELSPSRLVQLAAWPGIIRPRWPAHVKFWSLLAAASRGSSVVALQWAHCIGICLLDAAPAGGTGPHAGEGSPGRRLRR